MNAKFVLRMTAPMIAVSLLLLGVGVVAAWYVHSMQKDNSDLLALDVASMLAIGASTHTSCTSVPASTPERSDTSDCATADAVGVFTAVFWPTPRWYTAVALAPVGLG